MLGSVLMLLAEVQKFVWHSATFANAIAGQN
jgi:hypothetical protein